MGERNGKKVFLLAVCIAATLFGIYINFFSGDAEDKEPRENRSNQFTRESEEELEMEHQEKVTADSGSTELPESRNESSNETYTEGTAVSIYFANTDVLDQGNLPLSVQAVLVSRAQIYLNRSGYEDVTELYVDESSYVETSANIAFNCFMDGYTQQLHIEYRIRESSLEFSILED